VTAAVRVGPTKYDFISHLCEDTSGSVLQNNVFSLQRARIIEIVQFSSLVPPLI
jgi:hypothetical protein